jgi:hypothetical protein
MSEQLVCQYCGKQAKSKSGLTLHEKTCDKKTTNVEETKVNTSITNSDDDIEDEEEYAREYKQQYNDREKSNDKQAKMNPFQFGAFFIMADHVPILLDVDFCIALGNYILEHGSPNSAIMAFAHQLNKLDGD